MLSDKVKALSNTKSIVGKPSNNVVLPIIGATPLEINQMADLLESGLPAEGIPDVDLYERSFDECYLVQYDEHDYEFEAFVGVVFN